MEYIFRNKISLAEIRIDKNDNITIVHKNCDGGNVKQYARAKNNAITSAVTDITCMFFDERKIDFDHPVITVKDGEREIILLEVINIPSVLCGALKCNDDKACVFVMCSVRWQDIDKIRRIAGLNGENWTL